MGLDVTLLAAAFTKIIAKHRQKIYSQLMKEWEVVSPLYKHLIKYTISGIQKDQVYTGTNTKLDEILQAWVRDKVAKGTLTMIPNETRQRRHMIYHKIKPDDVVGTIEGRLFDENRDITDQDLVRYVVDQILAQVWEDRIYKQLYAGVYVAPTNNSSNPAENAVDGFGKLIELGLEESDANKRINGLNVGALEDDNEYLQMRDSVMEIHEKYRFRPMLCYMSEDHAMRYSLQREEIIGTRVNTEDKNALLIPRTNIRIIPEPSMVGSDRFMILPEWNVARIIDKKNDVNSLKAKDYSVDEVTIYGDYHEAWNFEYNNFVWANVMSNNGSGGGDEEEVIDVD